MQLGQNPYAEEALAAASIARNQGGMLRTSAPIGNERMLSTGMSDKVEINEQPEKNANYSSQNVKQNMMSAIPQAQASAIQGQRKNNADLSQAEYKAQHMLTERMAQTLYANDGGAAVMQLNSLAADPVQMKEFMRRIGESKQMAQGNNPHTKFQSTAFYG